MYYMIDGFENRVREMITFELGKKNRERCFLGVFTRNQTLDLQISHFDALPLSYRDSLVSKVHDVPIEQPSCCTKEI